MSTAEESNRHRGRPKRCGPPLLSPGEFEIMELLWQRGPSISSEIFAEMKASRILAYTTVMTVLDKLQGKGYLRSESSGKNTLYLPLIGRGEALNRCLQAFLRDYFQGSPQNLRTFLDHPATGDTITLLDRDQDLPKNKEAKLSPIDSIADRQEDDTSLAVELL